jgi:hypothetical protein
MRMIEDLETHQRKEFVWEWDVHNSVDWNDE